MTTFDFKREEAQDNGEGIPYFEDVTASDGWQGQSTGKDANTLKAEIIQAMSRLGGMVSGFERGTFGDRQGFRIHYVMESPDGKTIPGYIDVAALPVKPSSSYRSRSGSGEATRKEQSLRMALLNVALVLKTLRIMSKLSPGYIPLMPWMLVQDNKNLTQLWAEKSAIRSLMPPVDDEFIDAEGR